MNKAMLSGNTAVKQGCTREAQSVFAQKEKYNKKENKE